MAKPSTRREFLDRASATLLLAGGPRAIAASPKRIVVAGGGIAGLCCGYELMKRGHDVVVLEASGRVGGHVRTVRDEYADGLYVDAGAEHFTKPGYDLYWRYVEEFGLPYIEDLRRKHMVRFIDGKWYSEEQLTDPKVLAAFGFNQREVDYLRKHSWPDLPALYLDKYASRFADEYQPFAAGLDDLDSITGAELFAREGASPAAARFGGSGSALHVAWHAGILKRRGVPLWPDRVFRLKGGNSLLPETFAAKLGTRVRLGCPLKSIRHGSSGVTVEYTEFSVGKKIEADYLVCAMSAVMLRRIPVTPGWPEDKAWAIDNVPYYSATRPVLQSRTKFWRDERQSINLEFHKPALEHVWSMADDVPTERGLIVGTAQPTVRASAALETFLSMYPGKANTIESASIIDWSKDPWASVCETTTYRPGQLRRFWPALIQPHGRVYFAGAYCDNLNWGQEAATRSANRVALAIHEA